ncbi:uncharacterized protein LOC112904025 [Agrilus planipennis]|uniref:Uncharacterized protein LOC112904025 n=1 Tax=Agrilus planipennis TaxID=224129 RepID=A0A7F5R1W2_AGRPL|nr:uncharacterized protein LOC112904025 [Agrilus planipennis]
MEEKRESEVKTKTCSKSFSIESILSSDNKRSSAEEQTFPTDINTNPLGKINEIENESGTFPVNNDVQFMSEEMAKECEGDDSEDGRNFMEDACGISTFQTTEDRVLDNSHIQANSCNPFGRTIFIKIKSQGDLVVLLNCPL